MLDATDARVAAGLPHAEAMAAAIAEFGSPAVVADGFRDELAATQSRRVAICLLVTGPLVALPWITTALTSRLPLPWQWSGLSSAGLRLATQLVAVTAGVTAVAALTGIAATGRLTRWLPARPRRAPTAAAIAGLGAVGADCVGLVLLAAELVIGPGRVSLAAATAAAVASLARILLARRAAWNCLAVRATLVLQTCGLTRPQAGIPGSALGVQQPVEGLDADLAVMGVVYRERPGRTDRPDELDGLAQLQPRPGRRYEQGVHRLGGHEQRVARVVDAVDQEPDVRAARQPVDDLGMLAADDRDGKARGGECVPRRDRDGVRVLCGERGMGVHRQVRVAGPCVSELAGIDVVVVLVGDQDGGGTGERRRLGQGAGVDDQDPLAVVDPDTRMAELRQSHQTTLYVTPDQPPQWPGLSRAGRAGR